MSRSIVLVGGISDKLGNLMHHSYKVWDWRYDLENWQVFHMLRNMMKIHASSSLVEMKNTANRLIRSGMGQQTEEGGKLCTVRDAGVVEKAVISCADPPN